jgi:uncharacterized protein DUF2760
MEQQRQQQRSMLIIIILLGGIVFAGGNVAVFLNSLREMPGAPPLADLYQFCPVCLAYFSVAPLLVAILVAVMVRQRTAAAEARAAAAAAAEKPPAPAPPSPALAVRLLGLLQEEGRFIDFIREDIDAYGDAQVGAAVRAIHAGCRKALQDRIELARIFNAEEGSAITIETGFDPASVRLIGKAAGAPPFRGTLQHGGWRVTKVSLPPSAPGSDPNIIAPAEVEVG